MATKKFLGIYELNPKKANVEPWKRFGRGLTAGRFLLGMATLSADPSCSASFNKVLSYECSARKERKDLVFVNPQTVENGNREIAKTAKIRKKSRHPLSNTSEKSLTDMWRDFKPAAHLWAADSLHHHFIVTREMMRQAKDQDCYEIEIDDCVYRWLELWPLEDDEDETNLLRFLADAEHLRSYGENHFSSGMISQNRPTLDPQTTWKVPADISLPDPILARDLPPWPDLIDFCRTEYRS